MYGPSVLPVTGAASFIVVNFVGLDSVAGIASVLVVGALILWTGGSFARLKINEFRLRNRGKKIHD